MQVTEITASVKKTWGRGKDKWGKKTWDGGEIIFSATASLGPTEDHKINHKSLYNKLKKLVIESCEENNLIVGK